MLRNYFCTIAAVLCFSAYGAGNPFVHQRVADTSFKPVIDGIVDDAEWADASGFPNFMVVEEFSAPLAEENTVLMKFDQDNLYIAIRSRMDFDPAIVPLAFDDDAMNTVDSMQFTFINPAEHYWYSFMVERAGGKSDWRYHRWDKKNLAEWSPEWEYASRILPDRYFEGNIWEGEIAIPWKALDMDAPQDKREILAQITRYHGNAATTSVGTRISCWILASHQWALPDPDYFGTIIFAPGKPVFRHEGTVEIFRKGRGAFQGTATGDGLSYHARVWHIADMSQTFVDESGEFNGRRLDWSRTLDFRGQQMSMWSYAVNDKYGIVSSTIGLAELRQPFFADVQPVHSRGELVWLGEITMEELPADGTIVFQIRDEAGNVVCEDIQPAAADWFEERLPLEALAINSSATGLAILFDCDGNELYRIETPFTNLGRTDWMSAEYGKVTAPFGPWRPMSVSADGSKVELGVFKHKITFDNSPLPAAVELFGEKFSADKWNFAVETASGRQVLKTVEDLKITSQDDRGVTLLWQGASDEIALTAEVRVEFDTLAWYNIVLEPLCEGVEIRRLAIECPLNTCGLRYMRSGGTNHAFIGEARTDRAIVQPALPFAMNISGNGWVYGKVWKNSYWIGGEDRGMGFVIPSMRNVAVKNDYSIAEEKDGFFDLAFVLIDTPVILDGAVDYQFGINFTPAKEMGGRGRLRKVGQFWTGIPNWNEDGTINNQVHPDYLAQFPGRFMKPETPKVIPAGYFTCVKMPCWVLSDCQSGNPRPREEQIAELRKLAAGIKNSIGGTPCLWYDSLITTLSPNPQNDYLADFRRYPVINHPVETPATGVCAAGAWQDFYLSGLAARIEDGAESFYMDMSSLGTCSNRFHGCGWRDTDGNVHGVIPYLETREMYLRMQKMVKGNNPDAILLQHGSNMEWAMNWMDVNVFGEEWSVAADYSTLTPELFQLAYGCTAQTGTAHSHFAGLIYQQYPTMQRGKVTQEEIIGFALLHGDSVYNVNGCEIAGNMMVWDALEAFGVDEDDSVWVPYWRNPMSAHPDGAAVSHWERNGGKFIVVYNTAYEAVEVKLPVNGKLVNALDGKEHPAVFALPGRSMRLLTTH